MVNTYEDEVFGYLYPITVTIKPDDDYTVGSPGSAKVTVYDDDAPRVGLGSSEASYVQTKSYEEGETASFNVFSTEPAVSIMSQHRTTVTLLVTQTGGDCVPSRYLGAGPCKTLTTGARNSMSQRTKTRWTSPTARSL